MYHYRGGLTVGQVNRFVIEVDSAQLSTHVNCEDLQIRVKNTTSALLRPAYLQGPYIFYISIREDSYRPDKVLADNDFPPHFDANLKTNCSRWQALPVNTEAHVEHKRKFVVDVISQIIFSPSAKASFEVTIASTKKEVRDIARAGIPVNSTTPGLSVELLTTEKLWDMPPIPRDTLGHHLPPDLPIESTHSIDGKIDGECYDHLVVLTHGIHSNLTSDMLYLKEVIEATGKEHNQRVICKGFAGNACNTERGVKWLGKRVGQWVLRETGWSCNDENSSRKPNPYKKISFIAHSLGGLVQMYAVGYIHDQTFGQFFGSEQGLEPVNFITLASPLLGISAENPVYVKFALDFGLIGKTGQDLALTFKPLGEYTVRDPKSIAGAKVTKASKADNKVVKVRNSAPLLKLMSHENSACHQAISFFQNRTVYANIENDGIVPLRTSSLFFLDWEEFSSSQRARNASITSEQSTLHEDISEHTFVQRHPQLLHTDSERASSFRTLHRSRNTTGSTSDAEYDSDTVDEDAELPQIPPPAKLHDVAIELTQLNLDPKLGVQDQNSLVVESADPVRSVSKKPSLKGVAQAITTIVGLKKDAKISPSDISKDHLEGPASPTTPSTLTSGPSDTIEDASHPSSSILNLIWPTSTASDKKPSKAFTRSQTIASESQDSEKSPVSEPARTSFFKSLESVLNPPMPEADSFKDPALRDPIDSVIVHDKIYHPSDIPPLRELPHRPTQSHESHDRVRLEKIKLEEKIARGWHKDMSWRKVLVKLRPDAHNNIIVRRMFANSFGWPVLEHLVKTHFTASTAPTPRQVNDSWDRTLFTEPEGPSGDAEELAVLNL